MTGKRGRKKRPTRAQVRAKVKNTEIYKDWNHLLGCLINAEEGAETAPTLARHSEKDINACDMRPVPPKLIFCMPDRCEERLFSADEGDCILPWSLSTMTDMGIAMMIPEEEPHEDGNPLLTTVHGISCLQKKDIPRTLVRPFGKAIIRLFSVFKFYPAGMLSVAGVMVRKGEKWYRMPATDRMVTHRTDDIAANFAMSTSVVEDIFCTGFVAMRHRGTNTVGVFPTDEDSRRALAKLREKPEAPGRRLSPVRHWVKEHVRRTQSRDVKVRGHVRGVEQFSIDDWRFAVMLPLSVLYTRSREWGMARAAEALAVIGAFPAADLFPVFLNEVHGPGPMKETLQQHWPEQSDFLYTWGTTAASMYLRGYRKLGDNLTED